MLDPDQGCAGEGGEQSHLERCGAALRRVFGAFEHRNFRIMWAGAFTSATARSLQGLAQSWFIYDISRSAYYLGLTSFLEEIPIFAFSVVGGALADRHSRRKMLGLSQIIQMCCALTLAVLVLSHLRTMWPILCLSFVRGCGQALGGPAYAALVPRLVPARIVPNAIALNTTQFSIARAIGPSLGAFVMRRFGAAWCFAINGVSYLAPVASLAALRIEETPSQGPSLLASIGQGLRYLVKNAPLRNLLLLVVFMTIIAYPLSPFLTVFVREVFHRGPETLAAFEFAVGLGSSSAGPVAAALAHRDLRRILPAGVVTLALALVGFALSPNTATACAFIFLFGAAQGLSQAMVTAIAASATPDENRGRVMSVFNTFIRGGPPIGSLIAGVLIQRFNAPAVFTAAGCLLALIGLRFQMRRGKLPAVDNSPELLAFRKSASG